MKLFYHLHVLGTFYLRSKFFSCSFLHSLVCGFLLHSGLSPKAGMSCTTERCRQAWCYSVLFICLLICCDLFSSQCLLWGSLSEFYDSYFPQGYRAVIMWKWNITDLGKWGLLSLVKGREHGKRLQKVGNFFEEDVEWGIHLRKGCRKSWSNRKSRGWTLFVTLTEKDNQKSTWGNTQSCWIIRVPMTSASAGV